MKVQMKLGVALVALLLLVSCGCSQKEQAPASSAASQAAAIQPFLGRWDMTVQTPTGERPSWIEVTDEQGQPKILMVGFGGHAVPTEKIQAKDDTINFFPAKELFGEGMEFKGKLENGQLSGTATNAKGISWQWTGEKAPSLARTSEPKWGKSIRLFNGRNLDGWKLRNPGPNKEWKVVHGAMVKTQHSSDIITTKKFEDFKLHIEFKCTGSCNSGVYLRGRYEVQIQAPTGELPPNRSMGAIYGDITPNPAGDVRLGKWQTYNITLVGRTVTVVLDGKTIIDQKEIPGITGGALNSHEGEPGPIYLQGGETGQVEFRNIVITPALE